MSSGLYHRPSAQDKHPRPARRRVRRLAWVAVLAVLVTMPDLAFAETGPLSDENADTYRVARRMLDERNRPATAATLAESLTPFSVADDRRHALLMRTRMANGEPLGAISAALDWEAAAPRTADRIDAALTRGELHLLLAEPERALRAATAARDDIATLDGRPADERHFNARWLRLRHDAHRGLAHIETARQIALRLHVMFPDASPTKLPGLVDHRKLNIREQFRRAKHLYEAWAYEKARREFKGIIRAVKDTDRHEDIVETSRWHLAHIALNKLRDKPKRAETLFDALSQPGGSYAEEALYQLAHAHMRQEDYETALEVLEDYRDRYPDGGHTEDVFYYRGWLPYDHRHNERAIDGFEAYLDRYGKWGPRSTYIFGFLAWTRMRLGQWSKAIDTYAEMEAYGNMLVWGKALYWSAFAHWKNGDTDKAVATLDELRETYPVTYYGVLGEKLRLRISGKEPDAGDIWWPEDGGRADDIDTPSIDEFEFDGASAETTHAWRRVRALVQLAEKERARHALTPVYDDLVDAVSAEQTDRVVYAIGAFVGDYNRMWRRATDGSISAMPEPPDSHSLRAVMAYPRAYRPVVRTVAREFNLGEYLMYAIMRQESRYAPGQVSHTNAVGALQMIPSTARKVARDLGVEYRPREFHRPSVGFRFSGFYMRKLLDLFDGMLVPMAAAYNSGPAAVVEWFDENPDARFAWLIEEFAYNEGRNYCRKVAEHMVRYLYLYNDDVERRRDILRALFPDSRNITFPDEIGY